MSKFKGMTILELKLRLTESWKRLRKLENAYPEDYFAYLTIIMKLEQLVMDNCSL